MTGSGTALDPYVIWDVNDLQSLRTRDAAYYKLRQDIDASATPAWFGGMGFEPVNWPFPQRRFPTVISLQLEHGLFSQQCRLACSIGNFHYDSRYARNP